MPFTWETLRERGRGALNFLLLANLSGSSPPMLAGCVEYELDTSKAANVQSMGNGDAFTLLGCVQVMINQGRIYLNV